MKITNKDTGEIITVEGITSITEFYDSYAQSYDPMFNSYAEAYKYSQETFRRSTYEDLKDDILTRKTEEQLFNEFIEKHPRSRRAFYVFPESESNGYFTGIKIEKKSDNTYKTTIKRMTVTGATYEIIE